MTRRLTLSLRADKLNFLARGNYRRFDRYRQPQAKADPTVDVSHPRPLVYLPLLRA